MKLVWWQKKFQKKNSSNHWTYPCFACSAAWFAVYQIPNRYTVAPVWWGRQARIWTPVVIHFYKGNVQMTWGPFIYYISTFFINHNIFTNFLSNLFCFWILKISNFIMKISSKCNVEKRNSYTILTKKVVVKNQVVKLSFLMQK